MVFDVLIGDPSFFLHPVQVIGIYIKKTTNFFLRNFNNKKIILFISGLFISISTILLSFLVGKFIELQLQESKFNIIYSLLLFFGLSSCIATKGLISSVKEISQLIDRQDEEQVSITMIKKKVQKIVSRDVSKSNLDHLLRSTTESLTENAVDGIFSPLFWIFLGTISFKYSIYLPGPLSLGLSYKAISTLDSMIGYKYGAFKYLGFCGAKIEDYATFLPCRLVALTLPIVSGKITNYFHIMRKVFSEGSKYASPNSGISEAIFAYLVDIRLGGRSKYSDGFTVKPKLNSKGNKCSQIAIEKICKLIIRLQIVWTIIFTLIFFVI